MQIARFTVAYWCVLVAALLPLVCAGVAKFGQFGKPLREGGYDNVNPRAWWARQTDWRARANGAMANTFEALPFFFSAIIIAHLMGAHQGRLDIMAFLFVVLRIMYIMMYIAGMGTVRSVLWILGFLLNIGILFLGFR
jgi:uncharacterized MAPEG superfamily protein